MKYKKQHYIPQSYLKSWCDPKTPKNQEPYVWIVEKENKKITKKSPKNIFNQTDMYTIFDSENNRNLELEFKLSKIESEFILTRDNKILKQILPTKKDKKTIVEFIITTFTRTQFQKKEQQAIWEEALALYKTHKIDQIFPDLHGYVEKLHKQPMLYHINNFNKIAYPILMKMNLTILQSTLSNKFITSDNPVLWFDPSIFNTRIPKSFFGLASPDLEIMIPLSPNLLIKLAWENYFGYISVDKEPRFVDEINKLTVYFSDKFIVMNKNKFNPYWFDF